MKKQSLLTLFMISVLCFTSCTPSHDSMAKLNSTWDCDYVSFSINKKWDFSEGTGLADSAYGVWSWTDNDGANYIRFSIYKFDLYQKLSNYEAESYYRQNKEPEEMDVESTFVINNQAYIIISKPQNSNEKKILFYADKLQGSFEYAYYDESIVKNMIKSMSFKAIN